MPWIASAGAVVSSVVDKALSGGGGGGGTINTTNYKHWTLKLKNDNNGRRRVWMDVKILAGICVE